MRVTDPYKVLQVMPNAEQEVVRAAFRALALKYHPDHEGSSRASRRMQELNEAYALVRDAAARAEFDRAQTRSGASFMAATANNRRGSPPPARSEKAGTRLVSGRYAGWTLRDLASHDPDYLRWMMRHSSGVQYRAEITRILSSLGVAAA
jgi:curved DNA-binding protein CbpA